MQGMRLWVRGWRWLSVLLAVAVALAGVLHVHVTGHAPAVGVSASLGQTVHGSHVPGTAPAQAVQDCDDGQAAGGPCCMGVGGCIAFVPTPDGLKGIAVGADAPRPLADRLAAGPRPLPPFRPPRRSREA